MSAEHDTHPAEWESRALAEIYGDITTRYRRMLRRMNRAIEADIGLRSPPPAPAGDGAPDAAPPRGDGA